MCICPWEKCLYHHRNPWLSLIPTRWSTDEMLYQRTFVPTRINPCQPSNWWTFILTHVNPQTNELHVYSYATMACLWLVVHQTNPDYGVWNCLAESIPDVLTIIILQFWPHHFSRVWWPSFLLMIPAQLELALQAGRWAAHGSMRGLPTVVHCTIGLGSGAVPDLA